LSELKVPDQIVLGTDKGSPLLVMEGNTAATRARVKAESTLDDPNKSEDGESESAPVDKSRGSLVLKDGPKRPSDGNRCWEVAFRGGEGISSGSALEEEEAQEDKDLGPDTSTVSQSIDTESLETGQDNKNSCPAMVEGEGQMDEDFIGKALRRMVLLDDIVDVSDS
jgi:hypothetical protein